MNYSINCPNCNHVILLEINRLLCGDSFICNNCKSEVALCSNSKKVLKEANEKLTNILQNRSEV